MTLRGILPSRNPVDHHRAGNVITWATDGLCTLYLSATMVTLTNTPASHQKHIPLLFTSAGIGVHFGRNRHAKIHELAHEH